MTFVFLEERLICSPRLLTPEHHLGRPSALLEAARPSLRPPNRTTIDTQAGGADRHHCQKEQQRSARPGMTPV